ncbi:EAL domain-containing protein [Pseudoxanthomonas sp.]|uniref:putative bifunctional diguanylate cyclase/phosphodiesterase n=1 Tax=Pseudoxanthomonas sp. TaxID=1871049 RepID=UPI002582C693|nr:EAL domain-containing protein [Pseudoxanthomonas sp.]MCR6684920.1 EAL domain-containing protein [Pseudoxanthomonas sp.]
MGAAFVLMLAGGLLLVLQYVSLRREAIADATAQAHVVATSSAAAVMFGDGDAAHEVLQSLGTLASIRGARIADADGGVVAAYAHDGNAPGCRLDCPLVRAPILLHGQQVGSVIVWMDMGRVHHRLLGLAGAFLVASLAAFTLSLPLMRRMRARVRAAEARLQHLAHYDPVSGQQNRNAFNACLAWTPPRPAGERHALMQLDLDRFKEVNDSLGHSGGDELLWQVGTRIAAVAGTQDQLFRLGGDEFAVLMKVTDAADARARAETVLGQFQAPFLVGGQQLFVTASAGVSIWPDDGEQFHELAGNADAAMYAAKREGRRRVALYEPRLREAQAEKLMLQVELRRALDGCQFQLHYQPQVDAVGRLLGAEALLRWFHPELGAIAPSRFIPVAEDCGLIVDIGRWVIGEACRQAAAWRAEGHDAPRLAVNLSVRQTRDEDLPAFIDGILAATALPASCLELEITESVLLEDADRAIAQLARLRARGLHLAIDDFGTGYSSMAYLKRLPIDKLKIDMTFVQAIPGDGEAITTAILAMAHHLQLTVVAEGVETEHQHRFLRQAGCDQLQGYRIGRALPADAFAARWLVPAQDPA